ncbi:hypothetical protein FACS189487_08260 [Campylobacterota bacterium]|nr:hypothetical protein FACS189487_08260 [Campylobacterota bacterium]
MRCAILAALLVGSALLIGCDAGRESGGALTAQTPSAPANPPPPCVIDCGGAEIGSGDGSSGSGDDNIDNTPKYQVSSASGSTPPELPTIYGR